MHLASKTDKVQISAINQKRAPFASSQDDGLRGRGAAVTSTSNALRKTRSESWQVEQVRPDSIEAVGGRANKTFHMIVRPRPSFVPNRIEDGVTRLLRRGETIGKYFERIGRRVDEQSGLVVPRNMTAEEVAKRQKTPQTAEQMFRTFHKIEPSRDDPHYLAMRKSWEKAQRVTEQLAALEQSRRAAKGSAKDVQPVCTSRSIWNFFAACLCLPSKDSEC